MCGSGRVCFTKELEPIDCDGIVQASGPVGKMLGTCHDDKQIYFPDKAGEGPDSRSSNTVWGAVLGSAAAIVALVGIVLVGRKMKTQRRGYESI
jgi:hypothetical protein